MASEQKIQELLEKAKHSKYFAGLSDEDIGAACQDYRDRSDEDLDEAMKNIEKKDLEILQAESQKEQAVKSVADKMRTLQKSEEKEKKLDDVRADQLLKDLFARRI